MIFLFSSKADLLGCFGCLSSFPVSLAGANMLNMTNNYGTDWEISYAWFVWIG